MGFSGKLLFKDWTSFWGAGQSTDKLYGTKMVDQDCQCSQTTQSIEFEFFALPCQASRDATDDHRSNRASHCQGKATPGPDHQAVFAIIRPHCRNLAAPGMVLPDGGFGLGSPLLLELKGPAIER